jgi:hypothetical protein
MSLRIAADGLITGVARIAEGGQTRELTLAPKAQEPRAFFEPRSRLPADTTLSATVYAETLPRATVFNVEPREVRQANADRVQFRIQGVGFGPDAKVEIIGGGRGGRPIAAQGLSLERQAGGPEGSTLLADMTLRGAPAATYALRVTTGGQIAVFRNAVRVY